jgi:hypothetical protein
MDNQKDHNLCFVIDSTGSMSTWIAALNIILPEVILMTSLTGSFKKISIIKYGDYDNTWKDNPVQFSDWQDSGSRFLLEFAKEITANDGGSTAEAIKSALWYLKDNVLPNSHTHVLHLTDAPCHLNAKLDEEGKKERVFLKERFDWTTLVKALAEESLTYNCLCSMSFVPYGYLAQSTNGAYHVIPKNIDTNILRIHMTNILNGWFGLNNEMQSSVCGIKHVSKEDDLMKANLKTILTSTSVPYLVNLINQMSSRMARDEDYIRFAVPVLEQIINNYTMALCSNALFGRVWREFCRKRTYEKRNELMRQLDLARNKLSTIDKATFDAWNKESYNALKEINNELNEFISINGVRGLIRYNPDVKQHPHDVLEFARGCTAEDQSAIVKILMRLTVDENFTIEPIEKGTVSYMDSTETLLQANCLPLNLPLNRLFGLLLHLAAPGSEVSKRPSAILAVLASRSGCVISGMAREFLDIIKGKWLTWARDADNVPVISENFCVNFLYLLKSHPEVMTDEESKMVDSLTKMAFALRILKMEVEYETFQENSMDRVCSDHHLDCLQCGKNRPLSLVNENSICGYCLGGVTMEAVSPQNTFMIQCISCESFYARDKKIHILGKHKCHTCFANNGPSPYVKCKGCDYKFVTYNGLPNDLCGSCTKGEYVRKPLYNSHITSVSKMFKDHIHTIYGLMGLSSDKVVETNITSASLLFKEIEQQTIETFPQLYYNDTKVTNSDKLWSVIITAVNKQTFSRNLCGICCEPKNGNELMPSCGRTGCATRICNDCGQGWYAVNKPGNLVSMRHLSCAFCVKPPTAKTMRRWNDNALLLTSRIVTNFDPRTYYGWCQNCSKIKEHSQMECHVDAPTLTNFSCEECEMAKRNHLNNATTLPVKECPGCSVTTLRISGCAHLTCPTKGCSTPHWCWNCTSGFQTAAETYDHMRTCAEQATEVYNGYDSGNDSGYDTDY